MQNKLCREHSSKISDAWHTFDEEKMMKEAFISIPMLDNQVFEFDSKGRLETNWKPHIVKNISQVDHLSSIRMAIYPYHFALIHNDAKLGTFYYSDIIRIDCHGMLGSRNAKLLF